MGPDSSAVTKLVIYTDGSALLAAGWPRMVRLAGWAAVCFSMDPADDSRLTFLGVAFAPVLVGGLVPGSFGLDRPSAPSAELTAVVAVLSCLRVRLQGALPDLSIASDCLYAVKAPQLQARASANHALVKAARAEYAARATCSAVVLRHVKGHSGDPGNEMADVVADLGCAGELSHPRLLDWLALRFLSGLACTCTASSSGETSLLRTTQGSPPSRGPRRFGAWAASASKLRRVHLAP